MLDWKGISSTQATCRVDYFIWFFAAAETDGFSVSQFTDSVVLATWLIVLFHFNGLGSLV